MPPESPPNESSPLVWRDPPVRIDDYAPALWVPLTQLMAVHQRLLTMAERLPESAWLAPSAVDGWRRRDVLAHCSSHGREHHRPLVAVLAGEPLREWQPDPDDPALDADAWNARELAQRVQWPISRLADELRANRTESLRLWSLIEDGQLGQPYGLAVNLLAGIERHAWHLDFHADQIVNGPQMMR